MHRNAGSGSAAELNADLSEEAWERLEQILTRFEGAWRSGARPLLADYLADPLVVGAAERRALLHELVQEDLEYRLWAGEAVRVERYLTSYPELRDHPAVVLDLITVEWAYRVVGEPRPFLAEYRRRFPEHRRELSARLRATPSVGRRPVPAPLASTAPPRPGNGTPAPVPPVVLPDYELLRPIGGGGCGTVWLGCNRHNGQFCAVKLLSAAGALELDSIRAYKQRVQGHPHLVPIEHVGVAGLWIYYTMPLADDANEAAVVRVPAAYEALTLQRYGQRHAPLPVAEVLAIADQLLAALEHLHAADLLHRDVKPDNVLRIQGSWRLGDVGLLTPADRPEPERGTRAFWPPEGPRDRTADLYALGKTLYLVLTGAPLERFAAFAEGTGDRQDRDHRAEALRGLLRRACHDDPAHRFPTAGAFRHAVHQLRVDRPRLRGMRRWGLGAAAVVALAGGGVLWRSFPSPAPQVPAAEAVLSGELEVRVWTPGGGTKQGLKVQEPEALPVRKGEQIQVRATLSQPAYVYLLWLDCRGGVIPLYPWNDATIDQDVTAVPPLRPPQTEVSSPNARQGWPADDASGLETVLLLARRTPLPDDVSLAQVIGRLPPTPLRSPHEVAVRGFDGGRPVEAVQEGEQRGIRRQAEEIDEPLIQLMSRLREHFEMVRAVRFAHQGN